MEGHGLRDKRVTAEEVHLDQEHAMEHLANHCSGCMVSMCKLECVERQKGEGGRMQCRDNGGREGEWSVGRTEGGREGCELCEERNSTPKVTDWGQTLCRYCFVYL